VLLMQRTFCRLLRKLRNFVPGGGSAITAALIINLKVLFNKRARSASGFRPNKTRPASLLNGFKHDYKFNRYTGLLVFFI
jgi:hypothetical protein